MKEFVIPDVETVEQFEYSEGDYERLIVPASVKKIGDFAFYENDTLREIVLNEGLEEIGFCAFWGCTSLKRILFPKSLKIIGEKAFRNCTGLESVTFLGGPSVLDGEVFYACKNLKEVKLSPMLEAMDSEWGDGAFEECVSLEEIELPEGFRHLGCASFSGCKNLRRIPLPKSLVGIGEGALHGTAIKELVVPEGVTSFFNVIYGCRELERVVLPSTVRSLSYKEFSGFPKLKEVTLPARFRADEQLFFPAREESNIKIIYI